MKFKFSLIIILLLLLISKLTFAQNSYKRLYPAKCDSLTQANSDNPNFVILDVRTDSEWRSEHLVGSINRSTGDSDFQQRLDLLPKHKIYLLHCKSGGRSAGAFVKMQNLQFAEVYEMIGGINGWKSNAYPTTSEFTPKLMLVSHKEVKGILSDTIEVTVTNRANSQLTFQAVQFNDLHEITHNFDQEVVLNGAEDYTFSIYHSPGYSDQDSTNILLESNGGTLDLKVAVANETTTNMVGISENELQLYPNPARDVFFLKGISAEKVDEVAIYTMTGQVVFRKIDYEPGSAFPVAGLPDGIYIVHVKTGNTTIPKRIVIKR